MNVLIVNTTPFGPGGITTVINSYYKEIINKDIAIDIVAINGTLPAVYKEFYNNEKTKVFCFPRRTNIKKYVIELYKICRNNDYDVVHVHGNSGTMIIELIIARICGVKNRIAHCHNTEQGHKLVNKIINPLFRLQYTKALACSVEAGRWLFGEENFEILNNAIDLERFSFSESSRVKIREQYGISNEDKLLIHVGYFNEQKNQYFLIELLRKYCTDTKIKLLLVGDGSKKKQIENSCSDPRIIFAGSQNNIPEYMSAADMFIFPSKWEGLGIVMLEAQASGLQCIASTNVPAVVNISGYVMFLDLEEEDHWVNEINSFNPLSIDQRAQSSVFNIEKLTDSGFNIKKVANRLLEIYSF